jgi:hypothetical protein
MIARRVFFESILAVAAVWCLLSSPAVAALKFVGSGDTVKVDTGGFPMEMKAGYELMSAKCTGCHSFERIAVSLINGVAPVSSQPFDQEFMKQSVYNMFRKSEAKGLPISKDERKAIYSVLKYMLDESAR